MKVKSAYPIILILLFFCTFSYFNSFEKVESSLEDTILQSPGAVDPNIKIIAIDDLSLENLGQWPWDRSYMADMINVLSKGKAAVIGIDIMYSENAKNPSEDDALIKAAKSAGNVVIPLVGTLPPSTAAGKMEAISLIRPFKELDAVVQTGHINGMADASEGMDLGTASDSIIRKAVLSFKYNGQDIKSFDWVIASEYKQRMGSKLSSEIPLDDWNRFNITFAGGPGKMEHFSFWEVLNGDIPADYFEGSIVLIGPYSHGMAKDSFLTPLDHTQPMYGVEIHANIVQNLIQGNFKKNTDIYANFIILIFTAVFAYLVFRRLSPALSALIAAAYCFGYIIAAKLLYGKGIIIQLLYPIALIIIIYLILLAYRYIEEYLERKRVTAVFGRYVAPQVVDQILKAGDEGIKLGGTRREISVLFVDIRGFTPMSEICRPEEVVDILNEYLNLTASSIFKYGGTLDKFIGDATMAIFNAPLDLEDHAFKAVQTAWAMKEGSEPLKEALEQKFGRSVQFGIGINTGFAVVGNIGAKFRMDYTAIGDTVNTSARLESNAKPGQILISGSTYEKVKGRVKVTPLGDIKVKGKEQPVPVYQLDGMGTPDAAAGFQAEAAAAIEA